MAKKKELREGYTTGSSATAAAMAALHFLMTNDTLTAIEIPTPRAGRITIPIHWVRPEGKLSARACVIKDGGDDPDATHKAEIHAVVELLPAQEDEISLKGGQGVGRVTLPGLPVPPGDPAINPAPREQLREGLKEVLSVHQTHVGLSVTVEVPEGEEIAKHTMNPRLGIVGGISILGTRGTVKPFSHESYEASIAEGLNVAKHQGHTTVALSTGGRTERLLLQDRPDIPELASVQIADFYSFALRSAAEHGFTEIVVGCFFGKLVKMAQGFPYTHAKDNRIDFSLLADWCAEHGIPEKLHAELKAANTARHALELLHGQPALPKILASITRRALSVAQDFAGPGVSLSYRVYDFDGTLLCALSAEDNA